MRATLISWSAQQLASLRVIVEAEGYDIAKTLERASGTTLASLIENIHTDVLIVDSPPEQLTQDIATLGNLVAGNATVVVLMLSDKRDADMLVSAMQAGVREVLLSPPNAADLTAALRRFAIRKKGYPSEAKKHAQTIAFMSCKGGSGATFLATNFADILAKDFAKRTAFLDLDLQCGDAAYYLSPGPSQSDITELTRQIERLDAQLLSNSMLHIGPNFDLLSAPENPEANAAMTASQLERLLKLVQANYDSVVLDLDRVLDPITIKALDMSDVVYVVMENLLPFVRDAKRLATKFKALGYGADKIKLVVNRYEDSGTIDVSRIEKAVGLKVSHTIRSSFVDVAQAINTGVPITDINPNNAIVKTLRHMAQGFDHKPAQAKGSWLDRLMGAKH
jgi:pilus assembly protein CpaE